MSSVYVSEPPTRGQVVLETTAGDLVIELWSKEAPKACRNFVQLCLEGYYDDTIFHRVVPGWIVQGGDPTGTGEGGDSIYGAPFPDEFHSRLRFSRRGMLGMASTGPDANGSQFFVTLAPTPELQKKNTLFGTVVGDSLFNALKLASGEVDKDTERPTHPKRIVRARVLDNPFADIVPRAAPRSPAAAGTQPGAPPKRAKAVKNRKLLSFADGGDDDDVLGQAGGRAAMKSSHDLLASDPTLRAAPSAKSRPRSPPGPTHAVQASQGHDPPPAAQPSRDEPTTAPPRRTRAPAERLTFAGGLSAKRPRKGAQEDELLARLGAFQSQIRGVKGAGPTGSGWLAHRLKFSAADGTESLVPGAADYDVIDPRLEARDRGSDESGAAP